MSLSRPALRTEALLWFALLGPPLTWAAMHVAGVGLGLWQCNAGGRRTNISVDLWTAVLTGAAGAVVLAALASAVVLFFATRDAGGAPPAARVHFLATLALAVGPIFLLIVLMAGIGSAVSPTCTQS